MLEAAPRLSEALETELMSSATPPVAAVTVVEWSEDGDEKYQRSLGHRNEVAENCCSACCDEEEVQISNMNAHEQQGEASTCTTGDDAAAVDVCR